MGHGIFVRANAQRATPCGVYIDCNRLNHSSAIAFGRFDILGVQLNLE